MAPVLRAAVNTLVHVPDLVRYGSKPFREAAQSRSFLADLKARLRPVGEVAAYPPHQAFIGNLKPESLADIPLPWYGHPLPGASRQGPFGEILGQGAFYSLLETADQFGLLMLEAGWTPPANDASAAARSLMSGAGKRGTSKEIRKRIESGEALPLEDEGALIGCVRRDHEEDESLAARVLLENMAAKASGAHALRLLLEKAALPAEEVDYILSCSEEAVGDRYNRGGGNLAKAIGEMAGCPNAAGADIKAFCAAPVYALVHAAALVQAGVVRNAVVVGGGSLAKLGMKCHRHIERRMPVLEDVLGGVAFWVGPDDGASPRLNLDMVGRHPSGRPSTPQGMLEALVCEPLARAGRKIKGIDKYAVELHNPEVTLPAGAGDVPLTNYRTLAALAVMRGEIAREEIPAFIRSHGMPGFAPTQGHIPAGVPYLGHAIAAMRAGTMKSAMVVAKGSLFLGRMTQQADGASIVLES